MIRDRLTIEQAETIALHGLAFLAAEPELLQRFLNVSGLDGADLRARAADRDVLCAVVEFLLHQDDICVSDFCAEQEIESKDLHLANHVLSAP